jgi:hypothetical protein
VGVGCGKADSSYRTWRALRVLNEGGSAGSNLPMVAHVDQETRKSVTAPAGGSRGTWDWKLSHAMSRKDRLE